MMNKRKMLLWAFMCYWPIIPGIIEAQTIGCRAPIACYGFCLWLVALAKSKSVSDYAMRNTHIFFGIGGAILLSSIEFCRHTSDGESAAVLLFGDMCLLVMYCIVFFVGLLKVKRKEKKYKNKYGGMYDRRMF